jgi:aminoglycoside N3'-acetyltransferase
LAARLTQFDIENGLHQSGVKDGMMLEVHCALHCFGHVYGGAKTVIEALKQVVGINGAIVMPSFKLSPNLPLTEIDKILGLTLKVKILHYDEEQSAMGIVSNTFRKMPDVITGQGLFRVSAWGKDAEKHAFGFQYLIDSGGYALLLGVDIYRLSAMHYVEESLPEEIRRKFEPPKEARNLYPEDEWFIEAWQPCAKPWYTIQDRAYLKGFIVDCMIGDSKRMLLQVKSVIELYRQALQNEPFELYGLA